MEKSDSSYGGEEIIPMLPNLTEPETTLPPTPTPVRRNVSCLFHLSRVVTVMLLDLSANFPLPSVGYVLWIQDNLTWISS